MTTRTSFKLVAGVVYGLFFTMQSGFAGGPLQPPGPPGVTMKSLEEIEPRIAISSLPYTISNSGSYYVTTNLVGVSGSSGIQINADNVSLDLKGFTLTGVGGSLNGISGFNGSNSVVVRNGMLVNWGTDGINCFGELNSRFENLVLANNANVGLQAGDNNLVSDCNAYSNTNGGFTLQSGVISHCVAGNNGKIGISTAGNCLVADCTANNNTWAGINCAGASVVRNCNCSQNGGGFAGSSLVNNSGIILSSECSVIDCTIANNATNGIAIAGNNCVVEGNNASGNGFFGIYTSGSQSRIDNNNAGRNGVYGIGVGAINVENNITRNFAPGNGLGGYFNFSGNNDYAPIGTPDTSVNPWQNFQ